MSLPVCDRRPRSVSTPRRIPTRRLEFESVVLVDTAAATEVAGVAAGSEEAFDDGFPCAGGGAVFAPGLTPAGASLVVAVEQGRDDGWQLMTVDRKFGVGVHGARAVVVGQDHPEATRGARLCRGPGCGSRRQQQ